MSEDGGAKLTMKDIGKLVEDKIQAVVSGLNLDAPPEKEKEDTTPKGGNIAEQVKQEIEKIRAHEKSEAEKESVAKQLADLAEKTKEKAPVERRRIHRLMGWGD